MTSQFPGWVQENEATLPKEEKSRYAAQQACVGKILAVFETSGYSDDDAETTAKVVSLMNEVCAPHFCVQRTDSGPDADTRISASRPHGPDAGGARDRTRWTTQAARWMYAHVTARCSPPREK
jgi:hypothetical protein